MTELGSWDSDIFDLYAEWGVRGIQRLCSMVVFFYMSTGAGSVAAEQRKTKEKMAGCSEEKLKQ